MNLSRIVLGTAQFGLEYGINNTQGKPSTEKTFKILDYAKKSGISELDTANAYGTANQLLKEYLNKHPKAFEIMSKFTIDNDLPFEKIIKQSLTISKDRKIKGLYFHKYSDYFQSDNFGYLSSLKKSLNITSIGVSLYTDKELKNVISDPKIDIIQLPFNMLDSSPQKIELLKKAKECGKLIYTRSAFLQGLFFMKNLPPALYPLSESLKKLHLIASSNNLTIQDLALGYVTAQHFIDKIVIGVDSVEQLESNISAAQTKLSKKTLQEVNSIIVNDVELLNPVNWSNK